MVWMAELKKMGRRTAARGRLIVAADFSVRAANRGTSEKADHEAMFKIADYKQSIEKICKDLRVKRLDLVGSATREGFQPERSDIDVLVEFDGPDRLFDRFFELKTRLEQQLGRQVDIIQEGAVKNPYVKKSLNRDKVRIYGS